jgi:hypothetical protein
MTSWEPPAALTVPPPGFGAVQSVPAEVGPPVPRECGADRRPVYTPPNSRCDADPAGRWAAPQPRRPGARARAESDSGSSRGITKLVTHYDGRYGSSPAPSLQPLPRLGDLPPDRPPVAMASVAPPSADSRSWPPVSADGRGRAEPGPRLPVLESKPPAGDRSRPASLLAPVAPLTPSRHDPP